jgi:hypothetical protein
MQVWSVNEHNKIRLPLGDRANKGSTHLQNGGETGKKFHEARA